VKLINLEEKLQATENKLMQKDALINNFKGQLQLDNSRLNKSLVDLLNSSKHGTDAEYEVFHQEVVWELEKQLEAMRQDCNKEIDTIKEQCDDQIRKQRKR